jgi:hypothetical protein
LEEEEEVGGGGGGGGENEEEGGGGGERKEIRVKFQLSERLQNLKVLSSILFIF